MTHRSVPIQSTRQREAAAWIAVFAGVSAAMHVGKLAPALPVLRDALQIDLLQAGFLLSMVQLAGMSLGLLIGLSVDGLGLRRSMLVGLMLQIGASTFGAFSQSAGSLLVLRALEGLGFLWVVMPAPGIIRQTVSPMHLSRMLGVWGAYMPTGTAVALLMGPLWIALPEPLGGWSGWWLLLSALSLVAAGFVWRGISADSARKSYSAGVVTHAIKQPATAPWQNRLHLTLGSKGPWVVALCFAMYAGQWQAVVSFLPSIYAQSGVDVGWVGAMSAGVAAVNVLGNVASGRLLQRGWQPVHLLRIGYIVMAVGAVLCFSEWGEGAQLPVALRYGAVLGFSAVGGLIPGTLFMLSVRLAPSDATVSTTVGFMQQLSAMGQFAGPPMVAMVAQMTGGWRWTWLVTCACSICGLLMVQWVRRSIESKAHTDKPTHT